MGLIKKAEEIECIQQSLNVTAGAFLMIEQILQESVCDGSSIYYEGEPLESEFLHSKVCDYFAKLDYSLPEGLIISSGVDSSEPHHPGEGPIHPGALIVVDIFPKQNKTGFFADITRTYVKGRPSEEVSSLYRAVWEAHQASLSVLRPGLKACEPYDVACDVLKKAGYDVGEKEGFVHSLGHGLGTDVHEAPRLGRGVDTILEPGMVVTIEPGLYYKEIGGVRIEDTVLITEDGYQMMTHVPYTWRIA